MGVHKGQLAGAAVSGCVVCEEDLLEDEHPGLPIRYGFCLETKIGAALTGSVG